MSMTFRIPVGYLGQCAKGDGEDATHAEYVEFDTPMISSVPGFPDMVGVWHHVCDDHCDPNAKHKETSDAHT